MDGYSGPERDLAPHVTAKENRGGESNLTASHIPDSTFPRQQSADFDKDDSFSHELHRERATSRKREWRVKEKRNEEQDLDTVALIEATYIGGDSVFEREDSEAKSSGPQSFIDSYQQLDTSLIDAYLHLILHRNDEASVEDVKYAFKMLEKSVADGDKATCESACTWFLKKLYFQMETKGADEFLQDRAIYLIGKLARKTDWVSGLVAYTGGVEEVVKKMSEHQHSVVIQERAVATLLHLTTTEEARQAIVNAKGAESVCWAMKEFINVKSIQIQGSTALCNMAFGSTTSKKRIGKIGGIDGVVKAMENHASDAELQARCCLALRNLTCGSRVNQWIAGRARAMEATLNALTAFPESADVQYQGCVALANLCTEEPDNRIRAADCGVIEAVLKVMREKMGDAGLVQHILGLLRCLLVGNEKNRDLVGEEGGVRLVASILRQHILHPKVLQNGCEVIRHLMFTCENRMTMYNCGGLEVLIRVMREGYHWKPVAESCLHALANSAYDFMESKVAIGRHGGISVLLDCMSTHMDCSSIQEHGCRALRNMADSDDLNAMLLAESGALDSCIFACSGYPENAQIQEHAIAMLFNMAYNEDNVRRMRGLDVERVLSQARNAHANNRVVQNQVTALQAKIEEMGERPSAGRSSKSSSFNLASFARKGSKTLMGGSRRNSSRHRSTGGSGEHGYPQRGSSDQSLRSSKGVSGSGTNHLSHKATSNQSPRGIMGVSRLGGIHSSPNVK